MAFRKRNRIHWLHKFCLALLLVLLGITTNTDSLVWVRAAISAENFIRTEARVEIGYTIFKYSTFIQDKIEDNLSWIDNISSNNTTDDLEIEVDGDILLSHEGQIAPDITNDGLWWDDDGDSGTDYNWNFRQCWDISTTATGEKHLYLDIDTASIISAGNMNSDGSDIRFIDYDGNTVIEHYTTEGIDTDSTRIWIKPTLPLLNDQICMYYGNTSAATTSSRDIFTNSATYYNLQEDANNVGYSFVSYADSNLIDSGNIVGPLSQYQAALSTAVDAPTQTEEQALYLSSDAPIQPSFIGSGSDAIAPASFEGITYVYPITRGTNTFSFLATQCTANVNIYAENSNNQVLLGNIDVLTDDAFNFVTNNNPVTDPVPGIPNNTTVMIEVTNGCPILAYHSGGGSDSHAMYPASTEWLGVGTSSMQIAANTDGTVVTARHSNGTTTTYNLNRGQFTSFNGTGNQGADEANYLTSNFPIGVRSIADGDGSESTTFLPPKELGTKFIVPENTQYVAIGTLPQTDVSVQQYAPGCTTAVGTPQTVTASANPGKIYFGSTVDGTNIVQGSCFIASAPIFAIFEADSDEDEANLWSQTQNRISTDESIAFDPQETGSWNLGTGSTWTKRRPVIISGVSGSEQTVYIDFTNINTIFNNAQTNAGDIRFAGSLGDGSDNYSFGLQFYDSVNEDGALWAQVPSITGSFTGYIYYDTASTETTTSSHSDVFSYSAERDTFALLDARGVLQDDVRVYALEAANISIQDYSQTIAAHALVDFSIEDTFAPLGTVSFDQSITTSGPIAGTAANIDGTDTLTPSAFAGQEFLLNAYRGSDSFVFKAVDASASVIIEESDGVGWNTVRTDTITTTAAIITQNIADGESIRITSDQPIYASHKADSSDSKVLYPTFLAYQENADEYELLGVSTGVAIVTASQDNTVITIENANTGTTTTQTLTAGARYTYSEGGAQQGTGNGLRITSDKPISAMSGADADGSESMSFWSPRELNDIYAVAHDSQYISIVARTSGLVCSTYDESGIFIESKTSVQTPGFLHFGGTATSDGVSFNAGSRVECDKPVFAFIEKHDILDPGAVSDETNNLNITHARYPNLGETTWTDLDDPTIQEQGLYVEDGSLIGVIDLQAEANADHIWWGFFETIETLPTDTSITYEFQDSCTNPGTVGWQTYTQELGNTLSDQPCLAFRILLETTDRQYSPLVDEFLVEYAIPTTDTDFNSSVSASQETVQTRRRFWKVLPETNLISGNTLVEWNSSTGTLGPSELDLVRIDNGALVNQFTIPPTPNQGDLGNTTSLPAEGLSIEYDYTQTSVAEVNFDLYTLIPSSSQSEINHSFTISIP